VAKPVITTTSLLNGTKNTTYSQTLSVSGGLAVLHLLGEDAIMAIFNYN
jgi:hypothetical protein